MSPHILQTFRLYAFTITNRRIYKIIPSALIGLIVLLTLLFPTPPSVVMAEPSLMPMPLVCFSVADQGNELVSVDRFSGVVTDIGDTGVNNIEAIVLNVGSTILYAADENTATGEGVFGELNMTTGAFTPIGVFGTANNVDNPMGNKDLVDIDSLSTDPRTGIIWGVARDPNVIFAINPTTGSYIPDIFGPGRDYAEIDLSTIPGPPTDVDDLGIHPITGVFYVVVNNGAPDRLAILNINGLDPANSPGYNSANGTLSLTDYALIRRATDGVSIEDMEGIGFFNDGTLYGTTGNLSNEAVNENKFWEISLDAGTAGQATEITSLNINFLQDFEGTDCLTAAANMMAGQVFCEPPDTYNGVFDAGDTAQAGVTVSLYQDNGTTPGQVDAGDSLIQTTVTDGSGNFGFTVGIAGGFVMAIDTAIVPPGGIFTVPATAPYQQQANFQPISGPPFDGYGNNDTGNDFGFTCTALQATPTPTATPTLTLTPTATITPGGPTLTPTLTITPGGPSPTPIPGVTQTPEFSVSLNKTGRYVAGDVGLVGDQIIWTIVLTNTSSIVGNDIVLTDNIPAELAIVDVTATIGSVAVNGQQVRFTLALLDPGQSVTIDVLTTVLAVPADQVFDNLAVMTARGANGSVRTLQASARLPAVSGLPDTGYPPRR